MEHISLNRVELKGRVGQDPKITQVGDSSIARFSIATSEIYKDRSGNLREETTWHNVAAWSGRNIEDFSHIRKGSLISLTGRIRNSKYTGADGEERYFAEVVASRLSVCDRAEYTELAN